MIEAGLVRLCDLNFAAIERAFGGGGGGKHIICLGGQELYSFFMRYDLDDSQTISHIQIHMLSGDYLLILQFFHWYLRQSLVSHHTDMP